MSAMTTNDNTPTDDAQGDATDGPGVSDARGPEAADPTQVMPSAAPEADETAVLPQDVTMMQSAAPSAQDPRSTDDAELFPEAFFPEEPAQPDGAAQASAAHPSAAQASAAAAAPANAAGVPAAAAAMGYGPGAPIGPRPPRRGVGGTLRTVWGHTLGKVLIIGSGVLAGFLALGLVGGLAFAATRGGDDHRMGDGRGGQSQSCSQDDNGWQCSGTGRDHEDRDGDGQGPMMQDLPGHNGRNGQNMPLDPNGQGGQGGQAMPMNPNGGTTTLPSNPGAMGGLSGLLHGEMTAQLNGAPTVLLVQLGEVTAYTQGSSIAVKSSDGFTATYAISATSQVVGTPATGSTVQVLATKEGSVATMVLVAG